MYITYVYIIYIIYTYYMYIHIYIYIHAYIHKHFISTYSNGNMIHQWMEWVTLSYKAIWGLFAVGSP